MNKNEKDWVVYWNNKNFSSEKIYRMNMDIFIRATDPILGYHNKDTVLDIGSGFGYLPAFLKNRVKEIHCLDVSEWFLDLSIKQFSQKKNIFFYKLDLDNYTDLSIVKDKTFSKIICLGVIPYYKNIEELERLIEEVRKVAAPGAKFIITDIPTDTKVYSGAWSLLKTGLSKLLLFEVIKQLIMYRISDYYKIRSSIGLLVLSKERINSLIQRLDLDADIISTPMTINKGRLHILIRF